VYDKNQLIALVREKALRFGEFTLASGKKASYYLDGKQITLDSVGARLIGEGLLELLGEPLPAAVGGMAIGADPITAAVITMAGVRGLPLKGILVRKEAKTHGEGGQIVGRPLSGRVLIIDDVITAGTAIRESIEIIRAAGATPAGVALALDRQERGRDASGQDLPESAVQEVQRLYGIPCISILTLEGLIESLRQGAGGLPASALPAMEAYRARYGMRTDVPEPAAGPLV